MFALRFDIYFAAQVPTEMIFNFITKKRTVQISFFRIRYNKSEGIMIKIAENRIVY